MAGHLEKGPGHQSTPCKLSSGRTVFSDSRTPCFFDPFPQSPGDGMTLAKSSISTSKLDVPGQASKRNQSQKEKHHMWLLGIWTSLNISSISSVPVTGNIHFPLTALTHEITTNGSYPETFRPVNEKKTANWQDLLEETKTHGTGLFQNFSNWMKVGTFLKINKGVKSCPAGNSRISPSV